MNKDAAISRRELTAEELTEFRDLWNNELIELTGNEFEARGFVLSTAPGQAHLSWPAGEAHPGQNILATIVSTDGRWSPRAALDPEVAARIFEALEHAFDDIERQARDGRADRTDVALRAWEWSHKAGSAEAAVREAVAELQPIPESAEIAACAAVFVPAESDGMASA